MSSIPPQSIAWSAAITAAPHSWNCELPLTHHVGDHRAGTDANGQAEVRGFLAIEIRDDLRAAIANSTVRRM